MKKVKSKVYQDYPEHPYISPQRDLDAWEKYPEKFPYSKVEVRQMQRLEEDLLPGDIIMLWRIGFDNFTNESMIPDYFEYRYGVESNESKQRLIDGEYMFVGSVMDSLELQNAPTLKRLLKEAGLPVSGKKADLLNRVIAEIDEKTLAEKISTRRYVITKAGRQLLEKYGDIILRHGPKSM